MRLKFILLVFWGISYLSIVAQTKLDSLLDAAHKAEGEEKVRTLLLIARKNLQTDGLSYAEQALEYAQKKQLPKSVSNAALLSANIHGYNENYSEAYKYYNIAFEASQSINYKEGMALSNLGLGNMYANWSDHDQALEYLFKALKEFEEIGDKTSSATCLNVIGTVYDELKDYDKELQYFTQALNIYLEENRRNGIAMMYNNIGLCYDSKKEYDKALEYQQKSLTISESLKDTNGIASSYNNIGDVYYYKKDYDLALKYYKTSLDLHQKIDQKTGIGIGFYSLGRAHKAIKDYENAILFFSKALQNFQIIESKYHISQTYFEIYDTYKLLKRFEQALEYHELYMKLQDSTFNEKNSRQIKEVEARFQVDAHKKQILSLEKEKAAEQKLLYAFVAVTILTILLLGFVFNRYRQRQKMNNLLRIKNQQIEEQNAELLTSEKQLKELVATKDKFFSIISHDLRGPLNSLNGFLQVLIRHTHAFSQDEIVQFATKLDKSVTGLRGLLDNLLQWARSQTGTIEFYPDKIELKPIVEETYQLLLDSAKNKLIKLNAEIEPNNIAYADRNMILFVFRNIVANAIKFTPKGGVIQTIIKKNGKFQEISITDTGVGMDKATLDKLFRLDVAHSQKGTDNEAGTGLGLILCQEFIQKNGGNIFVKSDTKKGTTFIFTVPLYNK